MDAARPDWRRPYLENRGRYTRATIEHNSERTGAGMVKDDEEEPPLRESRATRPGADLAWVYK